MPSNTRWLLVPMALLGAATFLQCGGRILGPGAPLDSGTPSDEDSGVVGPEDAGPDPGQDAGPGDAVTDDGGTSGPDNFVFGPTDCAPMVVEPNVDVSGYRSDRYGWDDSRCVERSAALVRNDAADPGGSRGGYLREFAYSVDGRARIARGTGANNWNGWGYVVNHYGNTADTSARQTGTFRTLLSGPHHALHEFKLRMNPGGPVDVTIHWFFATGRDAPVVAVTFDSSPAGPNAVRADTRTPYGDFAFEGASTVGDIGGIGWGDRYRFTTTGPGPVTFASPWNYTEPNLVPHVRMWSQGVDAEMGVVQTQTFAQQVGGGDYGGSIDQCWGKTNETRGTLCSNAGQSLPTDWTWPFQLNQYELPWVANSHRLAWGTTYGAVGQTQFTTFGRSASGYPHFSYAVFMVIGSHAADATVTQVSQVERTVGARLIASEGAVRTSGPGGVGRTDNVAYAPAGHDPVYSAWVVDMSASGKATVTLDPAAGALDSPIFRFHGFSGPAPTKVAVNGQLLEEGRGYFATVVSADRTVWLTLNGTVTGPVTLHVE